MKRILSIAILMAVCAISAQAQLEVKETVGVQWQSKAKSGWNYIREQK